MKYPNIISKCMLIVGMLSPAVAFDLLDACALAQRRNLQIKMNRTLSGLAESRVTMYRSSFLPTLRAGAYQLWQSDPTALVQSPNDLKIHGAGLSLQQAIFAPAQWKQYTVGKLMAEKAKLDLEDQEQELLFKVTKAYFAVLEAEDLERSVRIEQNAAQARYETLLEQKNQALASAISVKQYESYCALLRNKVLQAKFNIQNQKDYLALLLDHPLPEKYFKALRTEKLPQVDSMLNNDPLWEAQVVEANLRYRSSALDLQAADAAQSAAQAQYLPTIGLEAQVGVRQMGLPSNRVFGWQHNWQVRLGLDWCLFCGGRNWSALKDAQLKNTAQSHAHQALSHELHFKLKTQLREQALVRNRLDALMDSIESLKMVLKSEELAVFVGQTTTAELLAAQSQLFAQEQALLASRYDYLLNCLTLSRLAGKFDSNLLERINNSLEYL